MKTNRPAYQIGCLILAGILVSGSLQVARGQEPAGATSTAAVISSVAIMQEPQRAAIRVEGAGRLDVHAARMQNPERLVLDFSGAKMSDRSGALPDCARRRSSGGVLRDGRAAWFGTGGTDHLCRTAILEERD
jgi:hypothetical protein